MNLQDLNPFKKIIYPSKELPKYRTLKKVAKPIEKFDHELLEKFNGMLKVLIAMEWGSKLGMAFPQIGIPLRGIIVLGVSMANPEFTPSKAPCDIIEEGCYSLPQGEIHRRERVPYGWLKYQNPQTGEWVEEKVTGLRAIVVQHEIDHLNGLLCNRK